MEFAMEKYQISFGMGWAEGKSWIVPGMQAGSGVSTLYFVVQLHPKRQYIKPMFYSLTTLVFHGYAKTSAFISKLLFTLRRANKALKTETENGSSAPTIWVYRQFETVEWKYWDDCIEDFYY